MAGFTHRNLKLGFPVHAAQWFAAGDRPEGPPDHFEADPFLRAALTPAAPPVVEAFSFARLRGCSLRSDSERHAEVDVDAFLRNCTVPMREHGWLPHPPAGPGVGFILCPGDWLITLADGTHLAEADGWFIERYEPV
jgi:hypothetical protein